MEVLSLEVAIIEYGGGIFDFSNVHEGPITAQTTTTEVFGSQTTMPRPVEKVASCGKGVSSPFEKGEVLGQIYEAALVIVVESLPSN